MDRETYRKAFDGLSFSDDFQARTEALLRDRARDMEKEQTMKTCRTTRKTVMLAAAMAAMLAVSVSAAVLWLSPSQVAEHMEEPLLAAAFESEDAVAIGETGAVGDYTVTLAGLVSGEDLSAVPAEYNGELISDRTYAVFTLARTDGQPLEEQPEELAYSPLVGGYHVSAVNAWTLGATCQSFVEDGTGYYLFDTRHLEMFADHTVYFAVYEGGVPTANTFDMKEDGSIALKEGMPGTLFILPLDESRADPEAAEAFVKSTGLEFTQK